MKMVSFTQCLAMGLAVWSLAVAALPQGAPATRATVADSRLDLVTAIGARGPHASLGKSATPFDRLVGTWDVEYTDFSKDGKVIHRFGEFIVGWVLDGRVVQDLWIVYPSGKDQEREVYTDLRYYDAKSGTWPSTFIDPKHASVAKFTGGAVGDNPFVFDTRDFGATDTRWSLNDVRPDSFVWREEQSLDEGKTWQLIAEHHMKRRVSRRSAGR